MRTATFLALALLAAGLCSHLAGAAPEGWHASMKDGLAAAQKSGKPVLVVTGWKSGV
jgi:hypothetical protein